MTVAGQSAGGGAVMTLLTMPRARGLFARAAALSPAPGDIPLATAELATSDLADRLGIPVERAAFAAVPEDGDPRGRRHPVLADGAPHRREPARHDPRHGRPHHLRPGGGRRRARRHRRRRPARGRAGGTSRCSLGCTRDEFAGLARAHRDLFGAWDPAELLRQLGLDPDVAGRYVAALPGRDAAEVLGQYTTDLVFRRHVPRWVRARAGAAPTWVYDFAWRSRVEGVAGHCLDVPFVFDVLDEEHVARLAGPGAPQELADRVHGAYVAFVRGGSPGWARPPVARRRRRDRRRHGVRRRVGGAVRHVRLGARPGHRMTGPSGTTRATTPDPTRRPTPMPATSRPRVIVTTDPELDDLNSMLRFLLYSNEMDVEGLVYASSQFHWAGDPATGVEPHRWPPHGERLHIDEAVDRYAEVHETLRRHADGYPAPDALRAVIAHGNTAVLGEYATDTPGSDLIRRVLLDDDERPVHIGLWAGPSTVARALRSIEEEFAGTPDWDRIHARVSRKAVLLAFGEQDVTFAEYIRPVWPELEFRQTATAIWGYFTRSSVLPEHAVYLSADWTRTHVSEVGPMGASYRVWGDGRQMAPGDDEDYFGLSGHTADELTAMGYRVWMPPQEAGSFISEGDSSNFAGLVGNGLRGWQHATWGGWGGRQERSATDPHYWSSEGVRDLGPDGAPRDDFAAARWFEDIQLDFAARLRWTVTPEYAGANHAPVAHVDDLDRTARPGERVELVGTATDPDGDGVTTTWWCYAEAGSHPGGVEVVPGDRPGTASITVPDDALPGRTLHLIFQARDDGTPAMTSYQRVVVTVA